MNQPQVSQGGILVVVKSKALFPPSVTFQPALRRLNLEKGMREGHKQGVQIQRLVLDIFGSATLRGSASAETPFPRASHPYPLPATAITPTLHEALGKAVSAETSLDTKI